LKVLGITGGPPGSRSQHLRIKRNLRTFVVCRSGRAGRLFSRKRVVKCRSGLVVLQKYETNYEACRRPRSDFPLIGNPAVLVNNGGRWRGLDDLGVATCACVSLFNEGRLPGELDDRTPAEVEAEYSLRSGQDGLRLPNSKASGKPRP
jgi:hypothetical protein